MPKILTLDTPGPRLLHWGGRAIPPSEYSRVFQQIFSKIFCVILDIFWWVIEGRAQYETRDRPIIDHLFEPHHHPQFWRLA